MTVRQKRTGIALSMPTGLAWGAMSSLGVVLLGTAITAKLIDSEIIKWSDSGYLILVTLILAAWLGGMISFRKIKRQRVAVCMMSGTLLFLLLMVITALFFGGQYSGVGETALLILCGSLLAIPSGNGEKKRNRRKIRSYNR